MYNSIMFTRKSTVGALLAVTMIMLSIGGYIIMTPTASVKSEMTCQNNDEKCLQDYIVNLQSSENSHEALKFLKNYLTQNPNSITDCHIIAHKLGRLAWDKYHNIRKLYFSEGNICGFGYLHGAITEALNSKSINQLIPVTKTFCDVLEGVNTAALDECWHGIGHGVVASLGTLDSGLQICETLPKGGAHNCILGALMEVTAGFSNDYSVALRETIKILNTCSSYSSPTSSSCIYASGPINIRIDSKNGNLEKSWKRCKKYAGKYLLYCAQGLGAAVPSESGWDIKNSVSSCSSIDPGFIISCLETALNTFANVFLDANKVKLFCNEVSSQYKKDCDSLSLNAIEQLNKRAKTVG